jgi:hypothetical protein
VTETYCAPNGAATPCPSGYDCNASLAPPRCVRLYCASVGTACSEDVQCALDLLCGPRHACVSDATEWFVGAWSWASGEGELDCRGTTTSLTPPTERVIIDRGTTAPLVAHSLGGCVIELDVNGKVARARPNQTCSDPNSSAAPALVDEVTLTLQTDRTEATITMRLRANIGSAQQPEFCEETITGRLERN